MIGFFAWIAIALGGYSPSTVRERRIKGAAVGVVALLLCGGGTAMVISDADNFPQIRDVEDFHSWADGRYLEDFTDADAQRIADMIGGSPT
ncbi:hypothetical protein Bequi_09750 [Brachybacterium sp. JHP9]|uniref:Uncharacterized protein n=1 Tax=Brachybacterium equifaecis TaxID=2910770 RepID=A0ABT0R1A2_9MICO|nr:hypothetical protein [Brachybacterium equifaecis]MCL6423666.1 hypothetical protein [Brachybacterium equifaecis]